MSGGIAYVYDLHGTLSDNLNAEMVDLEPLDDDDVDWLQGMLVAHVDATDSAVGQRSSVRLGVSTEALRQGDAARLPAGARPRSPRPNSDGEDVERAAIMAAARG